MQRKRKDLQHHDRQLEFLRAGLQGGKLFDKENIWQRGGKTPPVEWIRQNRARQHSEKCPRAAELLRLKAPGPWTPEILSAFLKCSLSIPIIHCLLAADAFLSALVLSSYTPNTTGESWSLARFRSCLCVQNNGYSYKNHWVMQSNSWPSSTALSRTSPPFPLLHLETFTPHLGEIQHRTRWQCSWL